MGKITELDLAKHLSAVLANILKYDEPFVVETGNGNVVIISEDEWNKIFENDDLSLNLEEKTLDISFENNDIYTDNKNSLKKEFEEEFCTLKSEIEILNNNTINSYGLFSDYDCLPSQEYKKQLIKLKEKEEKLREEGEDVIVYSDYSENPHKTNTKIIRQILRTFNAECDNIMFNLSFKNINKARTEIQKSFDTLNKLYSIDNAEIQPKLLELKLNQITNYYYYILKNRQEIEIQEIYGKRISGNKENGFIFVVSNIGSFGENIYKISSTKNPHPMNKINELNNSSVPFDFDVHAIIYSDNVLSLEEKFYNYFADKAVNKVKIRNGFFRISLDEIEDFFIKNHGGLFEFIKNPDATEYKQTLKIMENIKNRNQ